MPDKLIPENEIVIYSAEDGSQIIGEFEKILNEIAAGRFTNRQTCANLMPYLQAVYDDLVATFKTHKVVPRTDVKPEAKVETDAARPSGVIVQQSRRNDPAPAKSA